MYFTLVNDWSTFLSECGREQAKNPEGNAEKPFFSSSDLSILYM